RRRVLRAAAQRRQHGLHRDAGAVRARAQGVPGVVAVSRRREAEVIGRAAVAFAVVGACAAPRAHADAKKDQAALAKLDAAYAATGKLTGAARTQQACSDVAQIKAAADALPTKKPPAGSAIDANAWGRKVD